MATRADGRRESLPGDGIPGDWRTFWRTHDLRRSCKPKLLSTAHPERTTRNRLVLVACILGSVIVFVDSTVVNVALPAIQDDLGGGLSLQQWVVDAYLLTLGSLLLVGGSLGDLFGARRMFLIGIVGFGITSVICAAAPTGTTLIVGRGLQGVLGAILTPAGLAVIATTFSGEARGAAIGSWTAWTGIAFVIGPLAGGWLVTNASWRWVFLVNVPFAIVTAALVAYAVPARAAGNDRAKVDVLGGVLCVLGLGGPVFALIEEPKRGWSDPADPLLAHRRPRALRALRALGEPRRAPDASPAAVRASQLLVREPGDPVRVRRPLDVDVLPRPVPAAACGLHRAAQRFGTPPDHRRDVLVVAARRPTVDAVRAAVVHGRRPVRRRTGVDRRDPIAAGILVLVGAPAFTRSSSRSASR